MMEGIVCSICIFACAYGRWLMADGRWEHKKVKGSWPRTKTQGKHGSAAGGGKDIRLGHWMLDIMHDACMMAYGSTHMAVTTLGVMIDG